MMKTPKLVWTTCFMCLMLAFPLLVGCSTPASNPTPSYNQPTQNQTGLDEDHDYDNNGTNDYDQDGI